jgi:hypothetical protein
MTDTSLDDIINYCKQNDRVCPQPQLWNTLWQKLKNKKQIGAGWQPALPLILAAWWEASGLSKQLRLIEHLKWAEANGQLQGIVDYLKELKEEDWFHFSD